MRDINPWLAAVGLLLMAWGAFGLIGIWWARRRGQRCGAVYHRASEPGDE